MGDWELTENTPLKVYGEPEGMYFVRLCPKCGRFVKADDFVSEKIAIEGLDNATCSKCGRIAMPYLGWS
jgi:ribosomal protein S27AE